MVNYFEDPNNPFKFLLGKDDEDVKTLETSSIPLNSPETLEPTFLRGTNRFLSQTPPRAKMTCDKYPRVCRTKGSTGADCCKKKYNDVKTVCVGRSVSILRFVAKASVWTHGMTWKIVGVATISAKKEGRVYGMCSYAWK